MLNVVCVLKKPDTKLNYDETWVQKLQRGVARNLLNTPHKFFCISDIKEIAGVEVIPLQNNWLMYWSKIEIFRPGLFKGPTLYFDVDSMVTGHIDALVTQNAEFIMLTDYYPWFRNSGLMYWDASNPKYTELYYCMLKNPVGTMVKHRYKGATNYGDQEFIATNLIEMGIPVAEWQKILPKDWFLEFSFEGRMNPAMLNPSENTKICYCLGQPKFDNLPNIPLVKDNWV